MSTSIETKSFPIKITNFINPHLFQFKLDNIIVGQTDLDVEKDLNEHAQEAQWSHPAGYQPKEHEIVAVYVLEWRKWVRGIVDVVLDLNTDPRSNQYIIWLMDRGIPIKQGAAYILPMPLNLQQLSATSYLGGLAKCAPVEKRFDNATVQYIIENTDRFNEFLSTYAKQLIDEASEIHFKPLQKMDDNDHIFGDIQIVKHDGQKKDLLRTLIKCCDDRVRLDEHDIPYGIENWETTKTPRYQNDRGKLNTREAIFMPVEKGNRTKRHNSSTISVCSKDLDDEDKYVLDWSRKNTALARDMDRDIKREFDALIDGLERYMMATRERRPPMLRHIPSMFSINQSQTNLSSMFGSSSTVTDVPLISGSLANPTALNREQARAARFNDRLKAAKSNQQPSTTSASTTKTNAPKMVLIPAGFERDILEFHKLNDF